MNHLCQRRVDLSGGEVRTPSSSFFLLKGSRVIPGVQNDGVALETRPRRQVLVPAAVLWNVEEKIWDQGGIYVQARQRLSSSEQDRQ